MDSANLTDGKFPSKHIESYTKDIEKLKTELPKNKEIIFEDILDHSIMLKTIEEVLRDNKICILVMFFFENYLREETFGKGILSLPSRKDVKEIPYTGYFLIVGMDDKYVKLLNTYGVDWGDNGYFYISHEYLLGKYTVEETSYSRSYEQNFVIALRIKTGIKEVTEEEIPTFPYKYILT